MRGVESVGAGTRRWMRAFAYFAVCLLLSWASGVLPDLLEPLPEGQWFVVATAASLLLEVVAYGIIWPIGTYTLDRPRDLPVSAGFGLVWGVCEAQLLLSGYVLVAQLDLSTPLTVALAFVLLSAFQGVWHAAYWDKQVAPEHNNPDWNLRKVLLCHVPNLLATLTHYAVYGSELWFVVFQTVSLVLSSSAMRFPRPSEPEPVGRLDDATR